MNEERTGSCRRWGLTLKFFSPAKEGFLLVCFVTLMCLHITKWSKYVQFKHWKFLRVAVSFLFHCWPAVLSVSISLTLGFESEPKNASYSCSYVLTAQNIIDKPTGTSCLRKKQKMHCKLKSPVIWRRQGISLREHFWRKSTVQLFSVVFS